MEEGLLFLHILGAAMWLGGGLYALFAYSVIGGSGNDGAGRSLNALASRGNWFFGLANLLVLGSGLALVATQDEYDWTDAFVLIGIGAMLLSGMWQGLVSGKAERRMLEAFDGSGEDPAGALRRVRSVSYVVVAILLVTIYAMVSKWGAS